MRRPPPSQAAHRSPRSIAPGEPQRHRGHRARFRRNHEDAKNTKERIPAVARLPGVERRQRRRSDDRRLPGRSPSAPNASVRPRRIFAPADAQGASVPPWSYLLERRRSRPSPTRKSSRGEACALRERGPLGVGAAPGACVRGCTRSQRSPAARRPGPRRTIELLCDSFVSLCLRGCDVGGWLCASLCLCGSPGAMDLRFLRTAALLLRPCVQAGIERPELKTKNSTLKTPEGGLTDESLSTISLV